MFFFVQTNIKESGDRQEKAFLNKMDDGYMHIGSATSLEHDERMEVL